MANEIQDFFMGIPPVSRVLVTSAIIMFLLTTSHLMSISQVHDYWPATVWSLQFWRPFTSFLVCGGHPLTQAMNIQSLYKYSVQLETTKFKTTADFVFYIVFVFTFIHLANLYFQSALHMAGLLVALTYTWAQDAGKTQVNFYFLKFPAMYLPVFMLLGSLLLSGPSEFFQSGLGYLAAHLYLFLDDIWPSVGGSRLIKTPDVLRRFVPGGATPVADAQRSFGTTFNRPSEPRASGSSSGFFSSSAFQGKGRRLGS